MTPEIVNSTVFRESGLQQEFEDEILKIFNGLSPEQQMQCIAMIVAKFPDKIREETKK